MYIRGPVLRPICLPAQLTQRIPFRHTRHRAPHCCMRPLRQVPGTLRRMKLSQKFYSNEMLLLPCLSRSPRCSHTPKTQWNNEPLRRATPAGIPLTGPAHVFISVRRGESSGEPPGSLPVSGICTPQRSCALSSGCSPIRQAKFILRPAFTTWQAKSCTSSRAASPHAKH